MFSKKDLKLLRRHQIRNSDEIDLNKLAEKPLMDSCRFGMFLLYQAFMAEKTSDRMVALAKECGLKANDDENKSSLMSKFSQDENFRAQMGEEIMESFISDQRVEAALKSLIHLFETGGMDFLVGAVKTFNDEVDEKTSTDKFDALHNAEIESTLPN